MIHPLPPRRRSFLEHDRMPVEPVPLWFRVFLIAAALGSGLAWALS